MIILGVHSPIGLYGNRVHDSNITIIKDNTVLFSSAEARFSRKKYDGSFPTRSIKTALKRFNIKPSDVDIITWTSAGKESAYWNNGDADVFFKKIFKKAKLIYSGHHSSHAAAALLSSNFYDEDINIFTLDGSGDYYIGKDGSTNFISSLFAIANQNLKKLDIVTTLEGSESNQWNYDSLGSFYLSLSGLIMICITGKLSFPISYNTYNNVKNKFISENTNWGYILNGSPGKVMGLSAFGDYSKVSLPSPFTLFQADQNSFPVLRRKFLVEEELLGINYLNYTFTPADLAAWLQKNFEDVIIEYLKRIPVQYKRSKLCFGGGCALNINLNSRIISEGLYEDVHIHPAPSDEGLSFGSAMYYAWQNNINVEPLTNIGCIGNEYFDNDVFEALNKFSSEVSFNRQESITDVCNIIAQELSNNKIVAWFQGKSEYGPRALGNRSILANPTFDNRDLLNTKIKKREYWRPYAAVILEDYLNDWFTCSKKNIPYMLFSGVVKQDKEKLIPSVVHKDKTCRVQTVNEKLNIPLSMIITAFMKHTGVPILLNTSFNTLPGEPIVETPLDAIVSFLNSEIDTLVINNYLIKRK